MMIYTILYSAILSFLTTYLAIKWLLRYLRKIGLVVPDMNKENKPLVPISGGLAVMAGVFVGLMFFIFLQTFFYHDNSFSLFLFGAVTTLLLGTFIGFIDDSVIEKNSDGSSGLKQWQKPLLTIPIAIPLAVINAANTEVTLPILGHINLGIVYPMIIVPIGVICATNMVNMLAGFNGMETGMGLIYTFSLGLFAYLHNSKFAALIAFVMFACLLAFYLFNKYPAKILPGDSLTYLLGATIGVIAILGNIERAAIIASIPFFAEFILKWRSKFKAKSYGYYYKGKVKSYHKNKIYSLVHILTRTGRYTEKQITTFFIVLELIFCLLIWV